MLIYHPAYDAYHCVFRALIITNAIPSLEIHKLRLLDFYLAFPSELSSIRLNRELGEIRKLGKKMENEYHGPVSKKQTFRDMEHIQHAAYTTLAASKIFSPAEFSQGQVIRTGVEMHPELAEKLALAEERDKRLLDCVLKQLGSLPLQGENGLKARTGLMESRYDVI